MYNTHVHVHTLSSYCYCFALRDHCHCISYALNQVLNLWYKNYSLLRLVKPSSLLTVTCKKHTDEKSAAVEVFELTTYQSRVVRSIDSTKSQLLKKWACRKHTYIHTFINIIYLHIDMCICLYACTLAWCALSVYIVIHTCTFTHEIFQMVFRGTEHLLPR